MIAKIITQIIILIIYTIVLSYWFPILETNPSLVPIGIKYHSDELWCPANNKIGNWENCEWKNGDVDLTPKQ